MLEHTQVTYRPQVKVHRFPLFFPLVARLRPAHLRPWWLSIASWLNWVGPNDPLSRHWRGPGPGAPVIVESVWLRGDSCGHVTKNDLTANSLE